MSFSGQTQPLALHRLTVAVGLCVCIGSPQECNHQPSDSGEPPCCLLNTDSGKRGSIAFSCKPTGDFRSLQWTIPISCQQMTLVEVTGSQSQTQSHESQKGNGSDGKGIDQYQRKKNVGRNVMGILCIPIWECQR